MRDLGNELHALDVKKDFDNNDSDFGDVTALSLTTKEDIKTMDGYFVGDGRYLTHTTDTAVVTSLANSTGTVQHEYATGSVWLHTSTQSIAQTFVITVANNGGGNVFVVNGSTTPTLSLLRGGVYTFIQSDATNANHPIAIKDGNGNPYTTGIVSTGTPGSPGAQTVFTIPFNAPAELRYYCTVHGNAMGNTISVSTANFTANIIHVPETLGRRFTLTIAIQQGNTMRSLAALQLNGEAVDVAWDGDTSVSPTGIDVYAFTVLKLLPDVWTVLGSLTHFS